MRGGGNRDNVGGLAGQQFTSSITASYATSAVNGGNGNHDQVGRLTGFIFRGLITASYGFGARMGHERSGTDKVPSTNTATSATALTAGTAGANNHAGDEWNDADLGTLGAWDFSDSNQPPAILYNDYDGTPAVDDIDYCDLFEAANTQCGTLIPGQRTATTPQFGSGATDIQLTEGDTAHSITGNITLPATFTIDGSSLGLTWSIHHDPEMIEANRVSISGNTLIVPVTSGGGGLRSLIPRWIILRATTGTGDDEVIVNDYHLRIVQDPNLRLTSTADALGVGGSHNFAATSLSRAPIIWSVTNADGSETDHATIDANGQLTAHKGGTVKVIARVAAYDTYATRGVSHDVTINRLTSDLTLNNIATDIPLSGGDITLTTATGSDGTVTWSVSNTTLATITDNSDGKATLSPQAAGTVRVTAAITQSDTHEAGSTTIDITINTLQDPKLRFTASTDTLPVSTSAYTFSATSDNGTAITWRVATVGGDDTALAVLTDNNDGTATLSPVAAGRVQVIATIMADATWSRDTISQIVDITRLTNTLTFTTPVPTLQVGESATFAATHSNASASITWSVTDPQNRVTDLATITPDGQFTAHKSGTVKVVATVEQDATYEATTASHEVTLTRIPANLRFTTAPARLQTEQSTRFSVSHEGSGALTWGLSRTGGSPAATIDGTGLVTADTTAETVMITATVAETLTHATATITTTLEIGDFERGDFADFDGDGLIDIYDLTMLHNMRYDLQGSSYKTSADGPGITTGCPQTGCSGYELTSDLDFDTDGDGTWRENSGAYMLDDKDSRAPYFVVSEGSGGWEPIGTSRNPFTATLEGNGFVIRNLGVRRDQANIGLIGYSVGTIRNLGLEQALADYTGNSDSNVYIGPLAGTMRRGAITACHASGVARGGSGTFDIVGGLVGWQGTPPSPPATPP